MEVDAHDVPSGQQITTDVCIIGAGPAGLTIAHQLDGARLKVCLLESGDRQVSRQAQKPNRGESVGYPINRLHKSRVRAFGGSSHTWKEYGGWYARPLDPIDFMQRPGVPHSGWPFDRAHLDPYYERAHVLCDLGPYDYEPARWSNADRTPLLKLAGGLVENTMFQHALPDTFTDMYGQLARSGNVELLLNACVTELRTDGSGRVESLEVRRDDGSGFTVRPRLVVLAAGGIENARLLLLGDGRRGIGNDHDLAGRFFAERLSGRSGELMFTRPDMTERIDFYERHPARSIRVQGALRVSDQILYERQLLNGLFFVLVRPKGMGAEAVRSVATLAKAVQRRPMLDDVTGHIGNIVRGVGDLAVYGTARLRSSAETIVVAVQQEQAPNPRSRVTLGSARDRFGQPVARVDWQPAPSDRLAMVDAQHVLDDALQENGVGHVAHVIGEASPEMLYRGNHHHMGTTRMHDDPRHGVVDADGRVHGAQNVFVAGSSVFPTYGSSNPTLTIVALALRLADHVARVLKNA